MEDRADHGRTKALRAVDLAVMGAESGDEVMVRAGLKLLAGALEMIEGKRSPAVELRAPPLANVAWGSGGTTRH